MEALPPSWKDVSGGKGGLPAIEVRPCEIRSGGCHFSPFDQLRRRHGSRGGGGRSRSMRSWSRSVPAAMACAIVGKLAEDSSTVSPFRSTMRHRQSEARDVETAKMFIRRISIAEGSPGGDVTAAPSAGGAPRF